MFTLLRTFKCIGKPTFIIPYEKQRVVCGAADDILRAYGDHVPFDETVLTPLRDQDGEFYGFDFHICRPPRLSPSEFVIAFRYDRDLNRLQVETALREDYSALVIEHLITNYLGVSVREIRDQFRVPYMDPFAKVCERLRDENEDRARMCEARERLTADETYYWMDRVWKDEIRPCFTEIRHALTGEIRYPVSQLVKMFSPIRPDRDAAYNPILKFLEERSIKGIVHAIRYLDEWRCCDIDRITEDYGSRWNEMIDLCIMVLPEIGAQLLSAYQECRRAADSMAKPESDEDFHESRRLMAVKFDELKKALGVLSSCGATRLGEIFPKLPVPELAPVISCRVKGREANPAISVEPGEFVSVFMNDGHEWRYPIVGAKSWQLLDRFLYSLKQGEDHSEGNYPVDFTTADYNACKSYMQTFVDNLVERQPAAHKAGNKKYEPYARFRVELLGDPSMKSRKGSVNIATVALT